MFGKLLILIVALGIAAAVLLVDRQQRLDLAAEMSRTHARIRAHEQALWRLQGDVAYRTRPAEIRAAVERLGVKMVPIPNRLGGRLAVPPPLLAQQPVPRGDEVRYGGEERDEVGRAPAREP